MYIMAKAGVYLVGMKLLIFRGGGGGGGGGGGKCPPPPHETLWRSNQVYMKVVSVWTRSFVSRTLKGKEEDSKLQ